MDKSHVQWVGDSPKFSLGNQTAQADIPGQAYEYLIKKFADATNKKAGEFYTPCAVVKLMIKILDLREGESIYDPACGTGGMLLEAIHHVKENHGDDRTLWGKLYGQEKNLTTSAIARMNPCLHAASDSQIVRGDTFRRTILTQGRTPGQEGRTLGIRTPRPGIWGRPIREDQGWVMPIR